MENYAPFHEQLRYERERRNWSQAELAEKVGCDTKIVGRWENGETFPRSYHRQTLCELFGKSAEELGLMVAKQQDQTVRLWNARTGRNLKTLHGHTN